MNTGGFAYSLNLFYSALSTQLLVDTLTDWYPKRACLKWGSNKIQNRTTENFVMFFDPEVFCHNIWGWVQYGKST